MNYFSKFFPTYEVSVPTEPVGFITMSDINFVENENGGYSIVKQEQFNIGLDIIAKTPKPDTLFTINAIFNKIYSDERNTLTKELLSSRLEHNVILVMTHRDFMFSSKQNTNPTCLVQTDYLLQSCAHASQPVRAARSKFTIFYLVPDNGRHTVVEAVSLMQPEYGINILHDPNTNDIIVREFDADVNNAKNAKLLGSFSFNFKKFNAYKTILLQSHSI